MVHFDRGALSTNLDPVNYVLRAARYIRKHVQQEENLRGQQINLAGKQIAGED